MKTLFMLAFVISLCSCSVSKKTETNTVNLSDKIVEQDTTITPKPAMLNGKVITPSQNISTISPHSPKQEKSNQ